MDALLAAEASHPASRRVGRRVGRAALRGPLHSPGGCCCGPVRHERAYGRGLEPRLARLVAYAISDEANEHKKLSKLNLYKHKSLYQYGMKMDGDADVREETMVNALTNGLCQVYVDNPWLLPWIQKEIKSDSE